jgi:hypothetical protein
MTVTSPNNSFDTLPLPSVASRSYTNDPLGGLPLFLSIVMPAVVAAEIETLMVEVAVLIVIPLDGDDIETAAVAAEYELLICIAAEYPVRFSKAPALSLTIRLISKVEP